MLAITSCWADPAGSAERASSVTATGSFYVDPTIGNDVPTAGTQAAPWKTVSYAAARIAALPAAQQAGAALNVRAGIYPASSLPSTMTGTAAQPIVIQPFGGATVTFDAGLPALQQASNDAWEPVPAIDGGVDGEWRTKTSLASQGVRYAWGQMMASKLRLINYQQLGDLRAQNESFASVPLDDPRPAPGPLLADPTHKIPFVYLGPGVAFAFDDATQATGRIHVRLAHTHMSAPGITDYTGETDPNKLALSIARKDAVALVVASQHIVLKNIVVQNGGDTTLAINASAQDVTFDHCQVWGARWGVRIGAASGLRFVSCLFDGGLAPWTTRSDVKDEYNCIGPADCPVDDHGRCVNALGSKTHDILVIHGGADDSLYDHCTFRRAHDGLQLAGHRVEVAHSLFEDLDDEVWQFAGEVADVKMHENLVRQVLNPLSFAVNPTGGPIYVYRNVIDQRVPTRGSRALPPDTDKPWIWRYGSDVKNGAMPALYIYQNTFVSSHDVDKGSWISLLFASVPTAARSYLNNIHLALNLDRPLSPLLDAGTPATTAGNVWYRFQGASSPLFHTQAADYASFAALHAARPDWEVGSLYQDPQLANFTDEYFDYADGQPNTDYRPIANLGGVALPAELPDVAAYAGTIHAGALPANAPPLKVGIDDATVLPQAGVPIARAGDDQTTTDGNGDGFETVTVNGGASSDPEGGALTYRWFEGGAVVATTATASLLLAEGAHLLRLVVTDPTGKTDSDAIVVRVLAAQSGDNRLANPGFEADDLADWTRSAGASVTTVAAEVHSGTHALKLIQTGAAQELKQRVAVTPGATYVVSGWLKTQALTPAWATLTANVVDRDGHVLQAKVVNTTRGNSPYGYAEQVIVADDSPGATAVAIELVGAVDGAGAGKVWFDDLRVRDRNLLVNGGFETRSPDGQSDRAPGWSFLRPGNVAATAALAHGGRRSLELASSTTSYQLVVQAAAHVPGRRYRLTAWLRTDGATDPGSLSVRRINAAGANLGAVAIPIALSEGHYTLIDRTLTSADLPAATAAIQIEMRYEQGLPGTLRLDDVLLEALP